MGYSSRGRLGYDSPDDALVPNMVPGEDRKPWLDVACGEHHTAAIRGGAVYAWGSLFGKEPVVVYEDENAVQVEAKSKGMVLLTQSGVVKEIFPDGRIVPFGGDDRLVTLCCHQGTVMGISGMPEAVSITDPSTPMSQLVQSAIDSPLGSPREPSTLDMSVSIMGAATTTTTTTTTTDQSGSQLPPEFRDLEHLWSASSVERAPIIGEDAPLPVLAPFLSPQKKKKKKSGASDAAFDPTSSSDIVLRGEESEMTSGGLSL